MIVLDVWPQVHLYAPGLPGPAFGDLAELFLTSGHERYYRRVDDPAWHSLTEIVA